eukprot:TRINITY_DN3422_c0_g1_i1.p1 TRINITY_DN3422_c0_g1~~TRINITY_DN3422_c0_g1_i1.p1  ORF type:complete len:599 (+),score=81.88 TRINITY_DN3422_c0_g1_i1:572-2368(+)
MDQVKKTPDSRSQFTRSVNFRLIFGICIALVLGGLWVTDVDEILPSSRIDRDSGGQSGESLSWIGRGKDRGRGGRGGRGGLFASESDQDEQRVVQERDIYAEPYTPRRRITERGISADSDSSVSSARGAGMGKTAEDSESVLAFVELPDNKGVRLNGTGMALLEAGKVWQLANSSQMQSTRKGASKGGAGGGANGVAPGGPAVAGRVCSGLCGRHGWGECHHGECVCPVLYHGNECLRSIEFPRTGPLHKVEARYVGDMTMNQRGMAGLKWVVGFLPEKQHELEKGQRILGRVTTEFMQILPSRDVLGAGKVYQSCAIVGSSGVLMHYSLGKEITAHHLVMRFNSAPIQGFEDHVGNKTTIRLTNQQSWGFFEQYGELVLVPLRSRSSLEALIRVRQRFPRMRLAALQPSFLRQFAASFDFVPSTGLLGVMIALQRCHKVDLYGFQSFREQSVSYQYYDRCARPSDEERDRKEYGALRQLARAGLLSFKDPCVEVCHDQPLKCIPCQESHGFSEKPAKRSQTGLTPLVNDDAPCPDCSFTPQGCRRNRHWAFRRHRTWPRVRKDPAKVASDAASAKRADIRVERVGGGQLLWTKRKRE